MELDFWLVLGIIITNMTDTDNRSQSFEGRLL